MKAEKDLKSQSFHYDGTQNSNYNKTALLPVAYSRLKVLYLTDFLNGVANLYLFSFWEKQLCKHSEYYSWRLAIW